MLTIWTGPEVRRFLDENRDERDWPLFYLYLATGLRKSEALALKWTEIDLSRGFIRVRSTVT